MRVLKNFIGDLMHRQNFQMLTVSILLNMMSGCRNCMQSIYCLAFISYHNCCMVLLSIKDFLAQYRSFYEMPGFQSFHNHFPTDCI